ncbi:energy transducer TonB [Sphingomonas sp. PB4P5]|uniref:energy transducer TonB n=1 Tax=Parasphingomonas puruogangriensis TaxID=3096155 RepID=UPI002FCA813E
MAFVQSSRADRLRGAVIAIVLQGLIGYALIAGLAVGFPQAVTETLDTFNVLPPPPPPPPEKIVPNRVVSKKAEGAASPPNVRSKATEIVAPPPIVPPPLPPTIVAAEKPGVGNQATSGNADVPGPGTGSGGVGNGTGSGRAGDGDGNGGREIAPRQIKGRLKDSDWPHELADEGIGGRVSVRYVVTVDGRATDCEIARSSGSRQLDLLTCRLIEERFHFRPSLDGNGRPVESMIIQNHDWVNGINQ